MDGYFINLLRNKVKKTYVTCFPKRNYQHNSLVLLYSKVKKFLNFYFICNLEVYLETKILE